MIGERSLMDIRAFAERLPRSVFSFRGYNVDNLGRTPELLVHPVYGPILADFLARASLVCSDVVRRHVDLIARVREKRETSLEVYDEAIALIVAVELGQLAVLRDVFGIDYVRAPLAMGYSLGELTTLVASGVFNMEDVLRIPIALATDCIALAADAHLGVLFSRGSALPLDKVQRLCLEINQQGRGVVGVSSLLSPNSLLLMGQGDTLVRFREAMPVAINSHAFLRLNKQQWPPMHTAITWERCIPNRAAQMMHRMAGGITAPRPQVLSLVTGKLSYNEHNARHLLHQWVDHPQRLWEAVHHVLATDFETVVHVGPAPNIVPATFHRLAENVTLQLKASLGMRALNFVRRPWLKTFLPQSTALLRAPTLQHIVLEDWLLEQDVK